MSYGNPATEDIGPWIRFAEGEEVRHRTLGVVTVMDCVTEEDGEAWVRYEVDGLPDCEAVDPGDLEEVDR